MEKWFVCMAQKILKNTQKCSFIILATWEEEPQWPGLGTFKLFSK